MKHVMAYSYWQSGGRGRAALALLVMMGALAIGGARASIASANPCNPNNVGTNLYGEACLPAPSGSQYVSVGGYVKSTDLNSPNHELFVDNDMWIVQPGATFSNTYWVEAGIITGLTHCCQYQNFEFFWGDHRPGQGLFMDHVEGPAQSYTNYFDEIYKQDSTHWGITIGGHTAQSTNNTMQPTLIRTGTEEDYSGNSACSEQSSLDYQLAGQSAHTGWSNVNGNADTLVDNPPYGAWQSLNNSFYDWSGSSESQSGCASSLGFTPSLPPLAQTLSNSSTSASPAPSSPAVTGPPLTESQISQSAREFAASMGDTSPTSIEHVEGPRQSTVFALSGDEVSTNPDVYAIVMRGNFVAHNVPLPWGVGAPNGSVLTLVIDATTGQLTDFGLENQAPDLASLGPVTVDQ